MTDLLAEAAGYEQRDRPSSAGAALGQACAALAEAGRQHQPDLPEMCATCAFRRGCMTNMMAGTLVTAFLCATGADESVFACHHGMRGEKPTRRCAGWMAAQAADWPEVQAARVQLEVDLAALGDDDPVRREFDAWIAKVDPNGELDDFQRGRLWLRDFGTRVPGGAA